MNEPRFFQREAGEQVVGVGKTMLTEMQRDGRCDSCNKALSQGVRILGKVVSLKKGILLGSRFSPTCLECGGLS